MNTLLDTGIHRTMYPEDNELSFIPRRHGLVTYEVWKECGRLYVRKLGEEVAIAGPFRTEAAMNNWFESYAPRYNEGKHASECHMKPGKSEYDPVRKPKKSGHCIVSRDVRNEIISRLKCNIRSRRIPASYMNLSNGWRIGRGNHDFYRLELWHVTGPEVRAVIGQAGTIENKTDWTLNPGWAVKVKNLVAELGMRCEISEEEEELPF